MSRVSQNWKKRTNQVTGSHPQRKQWILHCIQIVQSRRLVPAFPAVLAVPSKQAVHTWLQRLGGTNSARPVLPSGSCNGPLLPGPTDSKWLVVKFCPRRNERVLKCGSSAHLLRSKAGDGRLRGHCSGDARARRTGRTSAEVR